MWILFQFWRIFSCPLRWIKFIFRLVSWNHYLSLFSLVNRLILHLIWWHILFDLIWLFKLSSKIIHRLDHMLLLVFDCCYLFLVVLLLRLLLFQHVSCSDWSLLYHSTPLFQDWWIFCNWTFMRFWDLLRHLNTSHLLLHNIRHPGYNTWTRITYTIIISFLTKLSWVWIHF